MGIDLHLLAYAVSVLLIVGAVRRARRLPEVRTRGSVVGCVLWGIALIAWVAYDAAGLVRCALAPWLSLVATVLFAGVSALTLIAPGIRSGRARTALAVVRPLVIVLCAPLALLLIEVTYGPIDPLADPAPLAFARDADLLWLNLGLVGMGLACAWFVGQRRSGAALLYLGACLIWGIANYFLSLFKGQTVLPADVLALSTAVEVSAGYVYFVGDAAVGSLCAFLVAAGVLALLPSPRPTRITAPLSLIVGLACAVLLVHWYDTHDLKQDYGVTVDVWATRDSYVRYGSVPCFLQRMQEVVPESPDGYDTAAANRLQTELAAAWSERHPAQAADAVDTADAAEDAAGALDADAGGSTDAASATGASEVAGASDARAASERPSVIAIMNESFSDLGLYEGVEGYAGIEGRLSSLGAFQRGQAYTSARGGGTCNSEFEYLTGSTLGSMGGGVYPYMFYDLGKAESLPRYFSALGYDTTAIHPEAPTNWRRDMVYEQMGFDRFISRSDFPADAEQLRGMTTDRATYDVILDRLRTTDADQAQFIFDVTLQNHGGYDTGLLDEYPYDEVRVNGQAIEGMSEYLSCIDASLDDLEYLLAELRELDRPVLVVFFGDHQPGFNDALAQASTGLSESEMSLSQVQERFATPYLIWANYDVTEAAANSLDDSEPSDGFAAASGQADELSGRLTVHDGAGLRSGDVRGETASERSKGSAEWRDLSLGYLMAQTVQAAGLPLTQYQQALLQLEETMPAVNLNGYMTSGGAWFWIGQESAALQAYDDYAALQYANLFDPEGNAAFATFERSAERLGL